MVLRESAKLFFFCVLNFKYMDVRYFLNWHNSDIVYCNGTYYKSIKDAIREAKYLRKTDPFYEGFYCCQILKQENGGWIESNIFEKLITF